VSFSRSDFTAALDYVRQRAVIKRGGATVETPPTIYTTGFGCTARGTLVSDTFGVK